MHDTLQLFSVRTSGAIGVDFECFHFHAHYLAESNLPQIFDQSRSLAAYLLCEVVAITSTCALTQSDYHS